MIVHIVMFRLKTSFNSSEKTEHLLTLKQKLNKLKDSIPEVLHLETGVNISKSPAAYDLVLTTHFDDEDNLDNYRKHPEHKAVLDYIKEIKQDIIVVDYHK